MSFFPVPDYSFKRLTDVGPEFLISQGITLLLLDLDNTISPYGSDTPTDEIRDWARKMKDAGITLFIVSNNRGERAPLFSKALDIQHVKNAGKPSRRGIREAMRLTGRTTEETALAGDQIYTDVLAAKRSGIRAILISPISLKNPLLAARYVLELPFRGNLKNKRGRSGNE